jgi:2-hydroxycyclohexanecarboxyl-CoA dehydrogenase
LNLDLDGKVALVTGGGQGVGRGLCLALAAEGAHVVVNDLLAERAQTVAREIEEAGGRALAAPADITVESQVADMIETAVRTLGAVDILINNAGVLVEQRAAGGISPGFLEMPRGDWDKVLSLNILGMMHCCRAVLPGMKKRRWGKIVNIMSEAGRAGEARLAVYSAAKAAMLGFTKAIAQEHGRDCINVNAVALGAISHEGITRGARRPGATAATEERFEKVLSAYPIGRGLGRFAVPEDVVGIVCLLASDRAAYITGQSIGVSGGFVML